ncbi:hypothetical protein FEM48_Zijuj12G0184100 [Ziziphus jujuba var. spinosa]|uniref:Uncharacterized protein n=1 Tax=Ziziphus jujuba var. spinosa TaxID=714518 RepID=A0A978UEU3_ZIZJJ|nr:hypothetical protein FEM48_Zijuj12G0184100 [Ziziphus jujuba var. spinosa]
MGCSESKQGAVATGNTIFRPKQSNNGSSKNSKDIETVQETAINDGNSTTNSAAPQQQRPESDNVEAESGGEASDAVKDTINENSHESLKGGKENVEGGNNGDVEERLISKESPNHFFSSRKDEELGIDGIVSEGRSGKSEYNTPRHGTGKLMNLMSNEDLKDDEADDDHNAVEEKELADHEEKPEAEEKENGKEETVNVEENLVKEEEEPAKATVEEKVSSPAEENKKTYG